MEYKELTQADKDDYNNLVQHPLQSWEWGEFREKTGVDIARVGFFTGKKLTAGIQISFHKIPYTSFTVGYVPKSYLLTDEQINVLKDVGKKHNAIFIQLEPNTLVTNNHQLSAQLKLSARPLFTKFTFFVDLTKSEDELLKSFHSKTRYNIRVAQKHGVTIQEENTEEALAAYIALTHETTKRQGFYAHTPRYHQLMWETLRPAHITHLFTARFQGKILATWILFLFHNVLYYPYGASSSAHKEVMASNLMMWEVMRWGKKYGANLFDLWGTPGPNPKPTDTYYGFHKFKMGYNPRLVEFVGSYDLVLQQPHYILFTLLDKLRWLLLKLKTKV